MDKTLYDVLQNELSLNCEYNDYFDHNLTIKHGPSVADDEDSYRDVDALVENLDLIIGGYEYLDDEQKDQLENYVRQYLDGRTGPFMIDGDVSYCTDAIQRAVSESVLSVDPEHHLDIVLGVGGPTVYFTLVFDSDFDLKCATYTNTGFKLGNRNNTIDLTPSEAERIVQRYGYNDPYMVKCALGLEG